MARPTRAEYHAAFQRHLAPRERLLFASRQHWIVLAKPTLVLAVVALFAVRAVLTVEGTTAGAGLRFFLAVLLAVLGWWLWRVLAWRQQWVGITSKRIIFLEGIVDRNVKMMPLAKLTDMTYRKTPLGDLLHYGTIVVESAGQEQALDRLKFIPHGDEAVAEISGVLFGHYPTIVKYSDDAMMARPWTDPGDEDDEGGDWVAEPPGTGPGSGHALLPGDPGPPTPWSRGALGGRDGGMRRRARRPPGGPAGGAGSAAPGSAAPRRAGSAASRPPGREESLYRSPDLRRDDDTDELPAIPVRRDNRPGADPLYFPTEWL